MPLPARTLALFVSDLHLQPSHPATSAAFFAFLKDRAMASQSLYLLGDIFEYWAGDDDLDTMHPKLVASAIREVSDAGVKVYWIGGNRDFLVNRGFAEAAGLTLLDEPYVTGIGGRKVALVHGDAQCTDDVKYMQFRVMVRQPQWQQQFLSMPLSRRKEIIAGLREGSREAQSGKSYEIMDVTPQAIEDLFAATGADIIIHGHTHRPAVHQYGERKRYVLPDWDLDTEPARGGWIAIDADGAVIRHGVDGQVL